MAQVYNHMILPLANARDKHTQVYWGIRDFEFRFGRKPEGMWLSETAADNELWKSWRSRGSSSRCFPRSRPATRENDGERKWQDVNGGKYRSQRAPIA